MGKKNYFSVSENLIASKNVAKSPNVSNAISRNISRNLPLIKKKVDFVTRDQKI